MTKRHVRRPALRLLPSPGRDGTETASSRNLAFLPSLLTIANLACGWACVVHALRGDLVIAVPFIGAAIVFDVLDGRIARMTGTTSEFGAQLDSLADLVSFGVAPAVLAYQWGLQPLGWLGWAAGFLYITAAALRLARFNLQVPTDRRYFVGLPSPGAAAAIAVTVLFAPHGLHAFDHGLGTLVVLVPAALMVSSLRYYSFKTLDLGGRPLYLWVLTLAAVLAALIAWPHELLLAGIYGYLLSGPIDQLLAYLRDDDLGVRTVH